MELYRTKEDNPFLFIIGGHSTAIEIRESAELYLSERYKIVNVIQDNDKVSPYFEYITDSILKNMRKNTDDVFIIGSTDISIKKNFEFYFTQNNINSINVIHPSAIIFNSANIGFGNYIGANVTISALSKIGNHNTINLNSTIGHDVHLGNYCCINPGARISGNVKIGSETLVGANSFIFQGLNIGEKCSIDAMTYIDRNIPNNMMCTSIKGNLKIYKKRNY
jgi:sugar O-acyltransferase (sialic acid O-acetyltransferase NeuD family)